MLDYSYIFLLYITQRKGVGPVIMIRTITLGSCVSVQGIFVKTAENGKIIIRVGKQIFKGLPVS